MAGPEGASSDLINTVLGQLGGGAEPPLVRGESGGGAVRVTLRGLQHVESVTIAVEATGDAMLGEMVAAAVNDALEKARAATQQAALGLLQHLSRE